MRSVNTVPVKSAVFVFANASVQVNECDSAFGGLQANCFLVPSTLERARLASWQISLVVLSPTCCPVRCNSRVSRPIASCDGVRCEYKGQLERHDLYCHRLECDSSFNERTADRNRANLTDGPAPFQIFNRVAPARQCYIFSEREAQTGQSVAFSGGYYAANKEWKRKKRDEGRNNKKQGGSTDGPVSDKIL